MQAIPLAVPPMKINLDAWRPHEGSEPELPDEAFIFYSYEMMIRGDELWPPSITSYHGHPVPTPTIELKYLSRGNRFWKVLVIFKKREMDAELGLLVERYALSVPAWQGENNTIHLLEELPGETDRELDMALFYERAEDIDTDYLTRMQQVYGDEELTRLAPEVFYYEDEAISDSKIAF